MSTPIILSNPQQINSTTYADLLGVSLGLPRLPGEPASKYFDRLSRAGQSDRSHNYKGLIDEINLELGLNTYRALLLSGPDADVNVSVAGVTLSDPANILEPVTSPLLTVDIDGIWTWRMLSDIVSDINNNGVYNAELLIEDAPAVQLAKQNNTLTVLAMNLNGQHFNLGQTGVIVGSELFSTVVPFYTLTTDGMLQFSQAVPAGTQITFQYRSWPYSLAASQAAVLGLMEPDVASVALTGDNVLVYNIREYIQAIMDIDLSYWGK